MNAKKHPERAVRHFASVPFIWFLIIPFIITDFFCEIYHRICFPLYKLKYIKRSEYIRIDRQKLSYLNTLEKISCVYCGYINGLLHYMTKIAAKTEEYWCGIMHEEKYGFRPPAHHKKFVKYNKKEDFEKAYSPKK